MKNEGNSQTPFASHSSNYKLLFWKIFQIIFWFAGLVLLITLLFYPHMGVTFFWNILIPVAPALLVIGTGVWRNICPLATTAMLPDRLHFSKKKKLTPSQQQTLNFMGVICLLFIIPLRHVIFNISGQATALLIISLSIVAYSAGLIFESKSGWCSGLCPVHPVEKLYGSSVGFSLPNTQCGSCVKCSVPCPDSTKNFSPSSLKSKKSTYTELLVVGLFPGYIWGWFHVPDYPDSLPILQFYHVYAYPVFAGLFTLGVYLFLINRFREDKKMIIRLFAAIAVSCYYWFRLPQLLGFSHISTMGVLINLTHYLPSWSMYILNMFTTSFFMWWMVIVKKEGKSWTIRPAYSPANN